MSDCVWFHVVTAGSFVLVDSRGGRHAVRRGDLVILSHGAGHSAAADPDLEPAPVMDLPQRGT